MTNGSVHPDVIAMCESVEVLEPDTFSILSEIRECGGAGTPPGDSSTPYDGATPPMLEHMEAEMYARLYTRPVSGPGVAVDGVSHREHLRQLSLANTGSGTWEPGWRIVARENGGRLAVAKDNVTFFANPADVRTRNNRRGPGMFCRVRVGKEIRHLVPGFYMAVGNGDQRQRDALDRLVRVYWNLTADVAVEYMARMTQLLNSRNVPFRSKVVNDPAAYIRADAGVLYVERRLFPEIRDVIEEVRDAIAGGLRRDVPMFTKRVADGVGIAEDPGPALSFGQSRVRIVARGLWACFEDGKAGAAARLEAVVAQFEARGLDPERPYLEKRGRDSYTLAKPSGPVGARRRGSR